MRSGALESQAAEQESEIAVLRTGVAHNEESLERLAREMEDSQGRADAAAAPDGRARAPRGGDRAADAADAGGA